MYNKKKYVERVKKLQEKYSDNTNETIRTPAIQPHPSEVLERSVISANLFHLMPKLDVSEYEKTINRIAMFQKWSYLDQTYLHLTKNITAEGIIPNFEELKKNPVIFCSYHLGSYRQVVNYLISKGIKLTLLIDENVSKVQAKDFLEIAKKIQQEENLDNDFRIVDTANPNMIRTLMRDLNEKRSLFVFLDGNKGVGGRDIDKDKLLQILFLNKTINVRKGIAFISYMSAIPMLPVNAARVSADLLENRIKFHSQICPETNDTRDSYIKSATQKLYAILENELIKFYEQWECWRYIDQALVLPKLEERTLDKITDMDSPLYFNNARYLIFSPNESSGQIKHVLFDRKHYLTNFISSAFCTLLRSIEASPETASKLLLLEGTSEKLLVGLLQKEVLVFKNIMEFIKWNLSVIQNT